MELLIGLVGIAVSVLLYFLGRRHGRQEREEGRRQARMERIAQEYISLAHGHPPQTSGPHGLIRAGVRDLRDDSEVREALRIIADRTGKHPLGRDAARLETADLKAFFDALQMDIHSIPNQAEVVERFSERSQP